MYAFKHKRWGEHSILQTKELAEEYRQKYGVEAALRFYEKEYAILARLFDDDSLLSFTCIHMMSAPTARVTVIGRVLLRRSVTHAFSLNE